jgi:hypothetical protein
MTVVVPRVLIIVAASDMELYDYFRGGFAEIDAVTVVFDRRRSGASLPAGGDRRSPSVVNDHLRERGFAIARITPV